MPSFPGGDQELLKFMAENTKYPPLARENGLQGIVVVTFMVDERGRIDKVSVLRGIGGGCDEEAIRVVKANYYILRLHYDKRNAIGSISKKGIE